MTFILRPTQFLSYICFLPLKIDVNTSALAGCYQCFREHKMNLKDNLPKLRGKDILSNLPVSLPQRRQSPEKCLKCDGLL